MNQPTYWKHRTGRTHVHVPGVARNTFTAEYGNGTVKVTRDSTYNPEWPDTLCGKGIAPGKPWGMTEVDSLDAGVPCKVCVTKLAKLTAEVTA